MNEEKDEIHPEPVVMPPEVTGPQPLARPSFRKSAWSGARIGFRGVTFVILPISLLALIVGLVPIALGLGAGGGFDIYWAALGAVGFGAVGFYLSSALWGGIIGAVIGLSAALICRARGPSGSESLWTRANRPIRLFRRRGVDTLPIEAASVQHKTGARWRPWRWAVGVLVFLILVVFTVAFGTGVYARRIVDRRLAAALVAADRDDPNWRLDDLMAARDVVPDAENSAIVVARVVDMMPKNWPGAPITNPGVPNPPPNEVTLAFDEIGATAINVRLNDEASAILRDDLRRIDDAVQLARTVANYSRGWHELDLQPALIDTLLKETQAARGVARLLSADAAIRAHDGDIDGALDSCRAILGVGRSIGDEPFLISGLVRIAIGGVALNATRRVLGQGEPSDAALAKLQALVLDELSQPLLLQGIKAERATMDEIIRRIADSELPVSSLSGNPTPGERFPRMSPWGKVLFDNQRAVGLEWMHELVAIARQPAFKQPPLVKAWEAEMARVQRTRLGPFVATIPLLMMPATKAVTQAHARYQCELGAMAIVLASERHRRKTGRWPESITAIDRAILAQTPVDPFSGQPFLLERRDGEFLVHSIGPDLEDDHGAYVPKLWMRGGPDDVGTGAWDLPLRRQAADADL